MDQEKQTAKAIGEATLKIKRLMIECIPDSWHEGELLVKEADSSCDRLCSIVTPLRNPDSNEKIDDLPSGILDAVEELYMAFIPHQRPWKSCLISFPRGKSGNRNVHTSFFYQDSR